MSFKKTHWEKEVKSRKKELKKSKAFKLMLRADRELQKIEGVVRARLPREEGKVRSLLEKFLQKYGETNTGKKARALLNELT